MTEAAPPARTFDQRLSGLEGDLQTMQVAVANGTLELDPSVGPALRQALTDAMAGVVRARQNAQRLTQAAQLGTNPVSLAITGKFAARATDSEALIPLLNRYEAIVASTLSVAEGAIGAIDTSDGDNATSLNGS